MNGWDDWCEQQKLRLKQEGIKATLTIQAMMHQKKKLYAESDSQCKDNVNKKKEEKE